MSPGGIAHEHHRTQRRDGVLLIILGVAFVAAGAFIGVVGSPWLSTGGIAFGVMAVVGGIVSLARPGAGARRALMIVMSLLFGAVGASLIATSLFSPDALGWRGAVAPLVMGGVCLLFFGGGGILLIVHEVRLRLKEKR